MTAPRPEAVQRAGSAPRNPLMTQQAPEPVEPYPSEMPRIKEAFARLQQLWMQKRVDDPANAAEHFNQQASNIFGEIGWKVAVEWNEARKEDGTPHNPFADGVPLYVPLVTLVGRTKVEEETDHDRMKHDIVTGKADGKAGYIDPNTGSWREDPKSKLILPR